MSSEKLRHLYVFEAAGWLIGLDPAGVGALVERRELQPAPRQHPGLPPLVLYRGQLLCRADIEQALGQERGCTGTFSLLLETRSPALVLDIASPGRVVSSSTDGILPAAMAIGNVSIWAVWETESGRVHLVDVPELARAAAWTAVRRPAA